METRFIELAQSELSDDLFFEEVFLDYIHYMYPCKETSVSDLARIRQRLNDRDPHTQRHLRDQIEQVLYRYNKMQHDVAMIEKIIIKRKIDQMDEQIQTLIHQIDRLTRC